jgi:hypothetical protein
MKEFFKDYREYQKNVTALSKVWYKKHWKGVILINVGAIAVVAATPVVIGGISTLKNKIKSKKGSEIQEDKTES